MKTQKARMARIRIAKATSGASFLSKKRETEARLAAQDSDEAMDRLPHEDIFELQHHHLLQCLERTTVSRLSQHMIGSFFFKQIIFLPGCFLYEKKESRICRA